MTRHRVLLLLRMRGYVPHSPRGVVLLATCALYVAAVAVSFTAFGPSADVATGLILGVTAACLALDWRGYWTLGHRVQWGRLRLWQAALLGFVFLLFYVAPAFTLWALVRQAQRARQAELAARLGRIAQLEHELGMDKPPSA